MHFNNYCRIIYCDNSFREGVTALNEGHRICGNATLLCWKKAPIFRSCVPWVRRMHSCKPIGRSSALPMWCCVDSLSVVSDPDVRKIPLPTEKSRSFCGAEREMDWIVALRGSADIIRGQVSAALTAAANVNTANSQHEFPCGQLAVGGHGCFCPRQPPRQLQPYLLLRIAQKPVVANLQHTGC